MVHGYIDPETIELIGEAWALTEEREDLLDFASDNIEECWRPDC
jgi:hypothetical protein